MPRPCSLDLRERLVAAVEAGESRRSAARRFGVSASSSVKWTARSRATGSVKPKRMGGYRRPVLEPHRAWLLERVAAKPDLTILALAAELAARGVKAGPWAVWAFFRREGLSFKKNPARRRAGPPGREEEARTLEAPPA